MLPTPSLVALAHPIPAHQVAWLVALGRALAATAAGASLMLRYWPGLGARSRRWAFQAFRLAVLLLVLVAAGSSAEGLGLLADDAPRLYVGAAALVLVSLLALAIVVPLLVAGMVPRAPYRPKAGPWTAVPAAAGPRGAGAAHQRLAPVEGTVYVSLERPGASPCTTLQGVLRVPQGSPSPPPAAPRTEPMEAVTLPPMLSPFGQQADEENVPGELSVLPPDAVELLALAPDVTSRPGESASTLKDESEGELPRTAPSAKRLAGESPEAPTVPEGLPGYTPPAVAPVHPDETRRVASPAARRQEPPLTPTIPTSPVEQARLVAETVRPSQRSLPALTAPGAGRTR